MDFSTIAGIASGHAEARAVQVATSLGLFEALSGKTMDDAAIAHAINCDRRATGLLANALTALGLLAKQSGRYALTPAAKRHLLAAAPEYLGDMILFDAALWAEWGRLEDSIRSGAPSRTPDFFQADPAATARFIRAMDSLVRARGDAQWTAAHLELAGVQTIADLGGGPGTYLAEFVQRWPNLHGTLWDLKATLEVAQKILRERAPAALTRIELRAADYRADDLPGPVDAIFMSNIIHSEDEAMNQAIAAKCFRALAPGGLLAIKDHIMNRDLTDPPAGAIFSLFLLLTTRGRDYSFDETAGWLHGAGFVDLALTELPRPQFTSSIITARKA
jgi:SAM-dependent methyltransferase